MPSTTLTAKEQRRVTKRNQERQALPESHKRWIDASEAAAAIGITEMAVKGLFRKGKIIAVKVKFSTGYTKWFADPESVSSYVPRRGGATGMRRFTLRVHEDRYASESGGDLLSYLKLYLEQEFGPEGDDNWTLERPKSSSKSKKPQSTADFTAEILSTLVTAKAPPPNDA